MRGRTLNDSFIILDEAQNTTQEQMKMVLTRQGFNSKMVVTGDSPRSICRTARRCGLLDACEILKGVEGISFVQFDERDVVRHSLVQRIVRAYEKYNEGVAGRQLSLKLAERYADRVLAIEPPRSRADTRSGPGLSGTHEIRPADNLPAQAGHPRPHPPRIFCRNSAPPRSRAAANSIACITGDAELQSLNRNSARKDYATDVLSFPSERPSEKSAGRYCDFARAARARRPANGGIPSKTKSAFCCCMAFCI